MGFALSPWQSLAAIMIVVVVMIVVPIAVMAPGPCVFQVTAAALGLAAAFPVFAFRIVQLLFRFLHLPFAFIVVVAVKRPCGNNSAQERQNHKRSNECLGFLEH